MPNRLQGEKSPYLRQHAHNPVDWYPWGEDAFSSAKLQDKPLFISIGYSTCHWCHVMERECFEDPEVASHLNRNFISIKVDREELPYIDHAYMTVCQALTGAGGWPLTIFATPEKEPFFAGTYFPKHSVRGRPGFLDLVRTISTQWQGRKAKLVESARNITKAINHAITEKKRQKGAQFEELLEGAKSGLLSIFDPINGGFGTAPKFPNVPFLFFLARLFKRTGEEALIKMLSFTLKKMRIGGIFDHIGGGFHRYSVDERWFLPHFEKMLYDQATLILAYLEGYELTKDPLLRECALMTADYALEQLYGPEGAFYAAQDADSEGKEGRFYLWSMEEIETCLKEKTQAEWFIKNFNITPEGNYESGLNIPYLKSEGPIANPGGKERVSSILKRLKQCRAHRPHPHTDNKVIASWNGLMIQALSRLYSSLKNSEHLERAMASAQFVTENMLVKGRLYRRFCQGEAKHHGVLDDYADLAMGLVSLYEATSQKKYLDVAQGLTETIVERFYDPDLELYLYAPKWAHDLPFKVEPPSDTAMCSPISTLGQLFMKLHQHTGEHRWLDLVEELLISSRKGIETMVLGYTSLLRTYMEFESGLCP